MTKLEAKKVMSVMLAAYPNYRPADIGAAVDVWADLLAGYPYRLVDAALRAYILTDTGGFAPSVGQIVDKMATLSGGYGQTESEAWAMVRKAIGNGSYHAEDEYAKLPEAVQKAVGSAEQLRLWAGDCGFNEGVESSNFKRAYRAAVEREREAAKLPEALRRLAAETAGALEG